MNNTNDQSENLTSTNSQSENLTPLSAVGGNAGVGAVRPVIRDDLRRAVELRDAMFALGSGRRDHIKRHLKVLVDPLAGHPAHIRLWAVGMLCSAGQECAVKQIRGESLRKWMDVLARYPRKERDGTLAEYALVPKVPIDFARALNISRQNVARTMRELERRGMARQTGKTKGKVRLQFFAVNPRQLVHFEKGEGE